MEIARTPYNPLRMVRAAVYTLLLLLLVAVPSAAQEPAPKYTIKHGRMYIELSRKISEATLDSFMACYDLVDLPLKQLLLTSIQDSLQKLGWKVEQDKRGYILSKELDVFGAIDNPESPVAFVQKPFAPGDNFPVNYKPAVYGSNRFRDVAPFAVTDSTVTFRLRGHRQAKEVRLAGSFSNWQHAALPMHLTDSGWITSVKLPPGKHFYKFIVDHHWIVDPDNGLRENDGRGNTNSVFYKTNTVFTLPGFPEAKDVYLTGSFNQWRPGELAMQKTATGWQLPLYVAEGTHTYKFVVDGVPRSDKTNPERLPDGQDGYNSVLRIGTPYLFRLEGLAGAQKVLLTGTFNNWREDELYLTKTANGWELPYVLGPGTYTYRLKVDGEWLVNPAGSSSGNPGLIDFILIIAPNYTFRLRGHGDAQAVFLAGTFNDWHPSTLPMQREGSDWVFPVHLTRGKHLYKFIVDGKWILDPSNKLWEQNEHKTGNSVLWVE